MMKKAIIIEDIGKKLTAFPTRRGLRSPINRPVKLDTSAIAGLINRDGCTKMYELDPAKYNQFPNCDKVLLTKENFDKPWEEIFEPSNVVVEDKPPKGIETVPAESEEFENVEAVPAVHIGEPVEPTPIGAATEVAETATLENVVPAEEVIETQELIENGDETPVLVEEETAPEVVVETPVAAEEVVEETKEEPALVVEEKVEEVVEETKEEPAPVKEEDKAPTFNHRPDRKNKNKRRN